MNAKKTQFMVYTSLLVLRSIRWMAAVSWSERLQILGVVSSEYWARQKIDVLEGTNWQNMEIHPFQKPQNKTIPCHRWECLDVWMWDLDHHYKNFKKKLCMGAMQECYEQLQIWIGKRTWQIKNYMVTLLRLQQKSKLLLDRLRKCLTDLKYLMNFSENSKVGGHRYVLNDPKMFSYFWVRLSGCHVLSGNCEHKIVLWSSYWMKKVAYL